jgi:hypothetical protein
MPRGIAIAINNFVAGTAISNVIPYPYFAVSSVAPLIQVADICAYVTARRATGDARFKGTWWADVMKLQWTGAAAGKRRFGFQRHNQVSDDQFEHRHAW